MDIIVVGHDENTLTGHMTVHVQSVTQTADNQTLRGPVKSYGIDPDAVQLAHGGAVEQWLAWVKQQHQRFAGVNQTMSAAIAAKKGKAL